MSSLVIAVAVVHLRTSKLVEHIFSMTKLVLPLEIVAQTASFFNGSSQADFIA